MRVSNYEAMRLRSSLPLIFLLLAFFGCGGPPSSSTSPTGGQSADGGPMPEITQELIDERINDAWVGDVPEETGIAPPISWNFDRDEPKTVAVVDKQVNGTSATIVLEITTESSPRARSNSRLSGQIRTEWALRTGWLLRKWEIVDTENISMKYKNLDLPPPSNSNAPSPPAVPK